MKRIPKGAPAKGCPPKGSWGMEYIIENPNHGSFKSKCYNCCWYDKSDRSCTKLPVVPYEVGYNYAEVCKYYARMDDNKPVKRSESSCFKYLPDYSKVIKCIDDKYFDDIYGIQKYSDYIKDGICQDENVFANIIAIALSKKINIANIFSLIGSKIQRDIRFQNNLGEEFKEYRINNLKKNLAIMNLIISSFGYGIDAAVLFEKNNSARYYDVLSIIRNCKEKELLKRTSQYSYNVNYYLRENDKDKIDIFISWKNDNCEVRIVLEFNCESIKRKNVCVFSVDKNSETGKEIINKVQN